MWVYTVCHSSGAVLSGSILFAILQEQSDLGLHCLLFRLHLLDALLYAKLKSPC